MAVGPAGYNGLLYRDADILMGCTAADRLSRKWLFGRTRPHAFKDTHEAL